jgi:hypothetical protein
MAPPNLSRRQTLISALSAGVGAVVAAPSAAQTPDIQLLPLPTRLYKTRAPGREPNESWVFWLMVQTTRDRPLAVRAMTVRMFNGENLLKTTTVSGEGLAPLVISRPGRPRLADGREPPVPLYWPQGVRMRCTEPAAAGVNSMAVDLTLSGGETEVGIGTVLPIEVYRQKTTLIYPFQGAGIVTNAGVVEGGHGNRSGQFALDGVGLTDDYGVYLPGSDRNNVSASYAGWGRPLVAPADGIVVRARSDRPDQPDPENSDPAYYAPEHPNGGDPGNHLVIDHENGEFSMMAHFMAGSMMVAAGERVRQGQEIGRLGSSGDTVTPHVHYQLQDGPDWQWADGLPCVFSNVSASLARGSYFKAR